MHKIPTKHLVFIILTLVFHMTGRALNVLTYNVLWELEKKPPVGCTQTGRNICIDNVIASLRYLGAGRGDIDIMAFQEMTPPVAAAVEAAFPGFNVYTHRSGIETMYTFVRNTHVVAETIHRGDFDRARPYMVLKIDNNTIFINVHFQNRIGNPRAMNDEIDKFTAILTGLQHTTHYTAPRRIVAGDFNIDFYRNPVKNQIRPTTTRTVQFGAHQFHIGDPGILTCCTPTSMITRGTEHFSRFDYVLDSQSPIVAEHTSDLFPASDHKPIKAELAATMVPAAAPARSPTPPPPAARTTPPPADGAAPPPPPAPPKSR